MHHMMHAEAVPFYELNIQIWAQPFVLLHAQLGFRKQVGCDVGRPWEASVT